MGMAAAAVGRLQPRGGGKQAQRAVNRIRVVLLAAFVTFLLLRVTVGFNRLARYSTVSVSGRARVDEEDIDRIIRKIRSDSDSDSDEEEEADTGPPQAQYHHAGASWSASYRLGPPIARWNAKRRRWLHRNPGFPSRDSRGGERVMLVTGSPAVPCVDVPGVDHRLLRAAKNKADYCRLHHGIDMVHDTASAARLGWSKLPLLRRLMLAHPETEWLWWLDGDAVVTDMGFDLPLERYVTSNLVVQGHHDRLFTDRAWTAVATGSFLLRNCQWSLELLDAWAVMGGPDARVRRDAGYLLSATLTGRRRPAAEADDQSALVHLLLTERDRWMDRVYLENEYHLHHGPGVDNNNYEEIAAKYHPGFGDARWPFVSHFGAGCTSCRARGDGGRSNNEEEDRRRCVEGMERALNFADNQVLRLYGFEHASLASAEVRRVANRSADPLQAKEEAASYLKKPKEPPAPKLQNTARRNRKRRRSVKGGESVLQRFLVKLGWRY